MKIEDDKQYHVITVKDVSAYAQANYNARNIPGEFWELIQDNINYRAPIADCSISADINSFINILKAYQALDNNHLKYISLNTPLDFVRKHLISDAGTNLMLTNKHLIKKYPKRKSAQVFYTRDCWIKDTVRALFKSNVAKNIIPTSMPQWAIEILSKPQKDSSNDSIVNLLRQDTQALL